MENTEYFQEVCTQYQPLINKLSSKLHKQYSNYLDTSEAKQECIILLWRCYKNWREDKGAKFTTFVYSCFHRDLVQKYYWKNRSKVDIFQKGKSIENRIDDGRLNEDFGNISESKLFSTEKSWIFTKIKACLSDESLKIFNFFEGRPEMLKPWVLVNDMGYSRYHANVATKKLKEELISLL